MEDRKCVYCGTYSSLEREHVIPAVWFGHRSFDPQQQWIVVGCRECNHLAGHSVFFSIPEKAKYIAKRYKSYFGKILRIPYWTEEEIQQESYKIRDSIRAGITQKQIIQRRIAQLEITASFDHDYLRPEWVKKDLKKMEREYRGIIKGLKNAKKSTPQKNRLDSKSYQTQC